MQLVAAEHPELPAHLPRAHDVLARRERLDQRGVGRLDLAPLLASRVHRHQRGERPLVRRIVLERRRQHGEPNVFVTQPPEQHVRLLEAPLRLVVEERRRLGHRADHLDDLAPLPQRLVPRAERGEEHRLVRLDRARLLEDLDGPGEILRLLVELRGAGEGLDPLSFVRHGAGEAPLVPGRAPPLFRLDRRLGQRVQRAGVVGGDGERFLEAGLRLAPLPLRQLHFGDAGVDRGHRLRLGIPEQHQRLTVAIERIVPAPLHVRPLGVRQDRLDGRHREDRPHPPGPRARRRHRGARRRRRPDTRSFMGATITKSLGPLAWEKLGTLGRNSGCAVIRS